MSSNEPPKVKRTCNRCYGTGVAVHEIRIEIVSRYGTAHRPGLGTPWRTDCGFRADGPNWWRTP